MTLLQDIVQLEKGRKYNLLEENQQGAIRVFQANDFRNENKPLYTLDKDGVLAEEDDIMLVWDGSVGQMGFGRSGYVGSTMVKMKVKNKKQFSPFFIYRFLQTKSEYLKRKATGSTILHINRKSLEKLEIYDFDLPTQLHIANILSKAENLFNQRKESIVLLDEFLKSTFFEMFGDPVRNEKGWKKQAIRENAKVRIGPFGSLLHRKDYIVGGIPLINPSHIVSGRIIVDPDLTVSAQKMKELTSYVLNVQDIILGRRGEMGRCAVVTPKEQGYLCGTGSMFIRPNENLDSIFLHWVISSDSIKNVLEDAAKGITMKNLNSGIVEKLSLPVPPFELQTQFAQIVEKTEALKAQYQQSLQELENLYGSLSQRAFRGELKLAVKEESVLMAAELESKYQAHNQLSIPPQKKGFAKLILAGKIINECKDSPEFTNIKFQKLQHLAEHLMEADLHLNYYNQAAGPYDNKFMHTLHNKMKQQKWFTSNAYKYSLMEKANKIDGHFSKYFGNDNEQFSKLIKLLGRASEDQCEIISTLYAVWNDRIIKNEPLTNGAIIQDFFNWSERKQKYKSEQLTKAIAWMKENGLEPKGFGKLIKHSKKKVK